MDLKSSSPSFQTGITRIYAFTNSLLASSYLMLDSQGGIVYFFDGNNYWNKTTGISTSKNLNVNGNGTITGNLRVDGFYTGGGSTVGMKIISNGNVGIGLSLIHI